MARKRITNPVDGEVEKLTEDEILLGEEYRICSKCWSFMRNLNKADIKETNPRAFWKYDRWYCPKCKVSVFMSPQKEKHPALGEIK